MAKKEANDIVRRLAYATILVVLLAGCNLPDYTPEQWSLSGDALFQGTPADNVKLASFYTYELTFYDTSQGSVIYPTTQMVSNVVDLGKEGGNFHLDIDASQLTPKDGQYIYLIMWIDADANGRYDAGEQWNYAIPRYSDPVFGDSFSCNYYYSDHTNSFTGADYGWNQSIGFLDYEPVYFAVNTGAMIANAYTWY